MLDCLKWADHAKFGGLLLLPIFEKQTNLKTKNQIPSSHKVLKYCFRQIAIGWRLMKYGTPVSASFHHFPQRPTEEGELLQHNHSIATKTFVMSFIAMK